MNTGKTYIMSRGNYAAYTKFLKFTLSGNHTSFSLAILFSHDEGEKNQPIMQEYKSARVECDFVRMWRFSEQPFLHSIELHKLVQLDTLCILCVFIFYFNLYTRLSCSTAQCSPGVFLFTGVFAVRNPTGMYLRYILKKHHFGALNIPGSIDKTFARVCGINRKAFTRI